MIIVTLGAVSEASADPDLSAAAPLSSSPYSSTSDRRSAATTRLEMRKSSETAASTARQGNYRKGAWPY